MQAKRRSCELFWPRHLIQIEGVAASDIKAILDTAEGHVKRNRAVDKKHKILSGRTLINLFFENSTRTRTSFELAGKRLSMDVINISAQSSSTAKGETLLDTAMTLNAMQADAIVLRHPSAGAGAAHRGKGRCAHHQRRRRRARAPDAGAARRPHHPPQEGPAQGPQGDDLRRHRQQPRRAQQYPPAENDGCESHPCRATDADARRRREIRRARHHRHA